MAIYQVKLGRLGFPKTRWHIAHYTCENLPHNRNNLTEWNAATRRAELGVREWVGMAGGSGGEGGAGFLYYARTCKGVT